MRILLIHNYYQLRGGEDVCVDSLYKLLKDNRFDVYLYAKKSADIKNNLISKAKVAFGMFYSHKIKKELSELIRVFHPDVAHFHNLYPLITPMAYDICKKFSLPIVQTIHNYRFICPKATLFREGKICEECVGKRFFYPAIKYSCYRGSLAQSVIFTFSAYYYDLRKQIRLINKFIFPSEFTRDYYIKHLHIPIEKTTVIPHFVDNNFVENNTKKTKKTLKNYFLYVGRLAEEKGVLELVEFFKKISTAKLVIIGDGPLKKRIASFTKFKNIIFYQYQSRETISMFMKNALATIIPSLCYEIGPMVLLESYSNKTPVIAPNIGVFKERVINGITGYFYEFNNFNDLKAKIKFCLKNKKSLNMMKLSIFNLYKKEYSQKTYLKKIIKVYNDIKKVTYS